MADETQFGNKAGCTPVIVHPGPGRIEDLLRHVDPASDEEIERFVAAIYADLGYFGREILRNSRSYSSILNGHPGPILPGVHLATGPMGQGFGVAQGFAIAGRMSPATRCSSQAFQKITTQALTDMASSSVATLRVIRSPCDQKSEKPPMSPCAAVPGQASPSTSFMS